MVAIVVVSIADSAIISGSCSLTASIIFDTLISTPRSITSYPAPSSIITHSFLPMSCRSPSTVQNSTLPDFFISSCFRYGFISSIPASMAFADISTSGTNISPSLNISPTLFIPAMRPLFIISAGSVSSSRASSTRSTTSSLSPSSTASIILLNTLLIILTSFHLKITAIQKTLYTYFLSYSILRFRILDHLAYVGSLLLCERLRLMVLDDLYRSLISHFSHITASCCKPLFSWLPVYYLRV